MATATETKVRAAETVSARSRIDDADTIQARAMEETLVLQIAAQTLMIELTQRCPELEPSQLRITPSEKHLLNAGGVTFSSLHDLCRSLGHVRGVQERLAEFSFDNLAAAEAELAEARENLATTKASLDDIDVGNVRGPVLAKQIKALQAKLEDLLTAESQAVNKVERLKSFHTYLLEAAPQVIKDLVDMRKQELQSTPESFELRQLEAKIAEHENAVKEAGRNDGVLWVHPVSGPRWVAVVLNFARLHCPDAIVVKEKGESVDYNKFADCIKSFKDGLPALHERRDELQAAVDELKIQIGIDEPIRRWIENRGELTIDDLQV